MLRVRSPSKRPRHNTLASGSNRLLSFSARFNPRLASAGLGVLSVGALLVFPSPLAWLGTGGLFALALARWRTRGGPLPGSLFVLPIGLYLLGALIGLGAVARGASFAEIRLAGVVAAAAAFFLMLDLVRSVGSARQIMLTALVLTVLALPALLLLTAPVLQVSRLPAPLADPIGALAAVGQPIRAEVAGYETSGQRYRLYGSGLGALAAGGIAIALGTALGSSRPATRLMSVLGAVYCGGFLVLSANRGALLSALLVACLLGAVWNRWLLAVACLVVGLGGLAAFVLADHGLRGELSQAAGLAAFHASDPGPLYVRLDMWQNVLFLMHDFVLSGAGLGLRSGSAVYRDYFRPIDPGFAHAHNALLQTYLEQGITGLLGVLGLLSLAAVTAARALARVRDLEARGVLLASGGAALALSLAGLTEIVMVTTVGGVLLFGALGVLAATAGLVTRPDGVGGAQARPEQHWFPVSGARAAVVGTATLVLAVMLAVSVLHPSVRVRLPGGARQAAEKVAARVSLNQAAVELARARLGPETKQGEHLERAEWALERANELGPGSVAVDRARAVAALTRGRLAETRRILEEVALRQDPADARAWFQVGRIYRQVGDVDAAIGIWLRVPQSFAVWSCSGPAAQLVDWSNELVQAGRWRDAVKTSRTAIELLPSDAAPFVLLTVALTATEGVAAAEASLRELASAHPEIPWAAQELAALYARQGRAAESDAWNERAEAARASPGWRELLLTRARTCSYA